MSGYRIGTWPDGRPVNIDVPDALVGKIKADARAEVAAKVRETAKGLRYAPDRRKTLEDVADKIEEGTL